MSRPKLYNRVNRDLMCEERYRQLSADARLVLLHLLCCPEVTAIPGLLRIRRSTLLEDVPMAPRRFGVAWGQLEAHAFVRADWTSGLVWVVDGYDHNTPDNPNVVLGWSKYLALLPRCSLLSEATSHLQVLVSARGGAFVESSKEILESGGMVSGGLAEGLANQDQDQNQDQKQEQKERETESAEPAERKPLAAPASFLESREEKSEKPPRAAKRTDLPDGWRPSPALWARLSETYRPEDLEEELASLHLNEGKGQGETQASWDNRFEAWVRFGEKKLGTIAPKPPSRKATAKPKAEPATPKTTTPDEDRAGLANFDTMISEAKADPDLAWNLESMIAARGRLAAKMATDALPPIPVGPIYEPTPEELEAHRANMAAWSRPGDTPALVTRPTDDADPPPSPTQIANFEAARARALEKAKRAAEEFAKADEAQAREKKAADESSPGTAFCRDREAAANDEAVS